MNFNDRTNVLKCVFIVFTRTVSWNKFHKVDNIILILQLISFINFVYKTTYAAIRARWLYSFKRGVYPNHANSFSFFLIDFCCVFDCQLRITLDYAEGQFLRRRDPNIVYFSLTRVRKRR